MELVYVYIDKFKNLENQEINLSPLVTFSFKKENHKLILEYNKSVQPANFFSENILNITGLIGGNGSGKTSILEYLMKEKAIGLKKHIFIYHHVETGNYICYSYFDITMKPDIVEIIKIYSDGEQAHSIKYEPNNLIIYFSNFYHGLPIVNQRLQNESALYDISTDAIVDRTTLSAKGVDQYYINEINRFVHFFGKYDSYLDNISFPSPKFISLRINLFDLSNIEENDNRFGALPVHKFISDLTNRAREIKKDNGGHKYVFLVAVFVLLDDEDIIPIFDDLYDPPFPDVDTFVDYSNSELSSSIAHWFKDLHLTKDLTADRILKLLNILDKIEKGSSFELQGKSFPVDDIKVLFEILQDFRFNRYYPFELTWSVEDGGEPIKFSGGENTMISLFSRIYECNLQNTDNTILLLLDEPDISLHPNYQKKFLSYFISFLEEVYPSKKNQFQIIITSHSPFITSDLPNDNIQYLDKSTKNKQLTFAANIHDLLDNSYYMKDGFVGEFAKQQINNILSLLESNEELLEEKPHIEYVISRVGEPLIKKHLQFMFDKKFSTPYDERIALLETEIKRLEKERDQSLNEENEKQNSDDDN